MRRWAAWCTLVAGLCILNLPTMPGTVQPWSVLRLPLEVVLVFALFLVLGARARWLAWPLGVVLTAIAVLKGLDLGYGLAFGRRFDQLSDPGYFDDAFNLLRESVGSVVALLAVTAVIATILALAGVFARGLVQIVELLVERPRAATRVAVMLGVVWVVVALSGAQLVPGQPVAHAGTARLIADHVDDQRRAREEQSRFSAQLSAAQQHGAVNAKEPKGRPFQVLTGKDVIVVFVESYGRVAIEDPTISPTAAAALADSQRQLAAAGYQSRTGYLTSPAFGGGSWIAHATLQSGVWVDNQSKYAQLLDSSQPTLLTTLADAGWRTHCVSPANTEEWPPGRSFVGCQTVDDARTLNYRGPRLGYAHIPDQYSLAVFARDELRPGAPPVAAEIDLVSSHVPWRQVPELVDWATIGDGADIGRAGTPRAPVKAAYASALAYSLRSVSGFAENIRQRDAVLIVLGDHQPYARVTGETTVRDVPISIITRDETLLERAAAWGWTSGLKPTGRTPVWRMDQFQPRFIEATR